MIVGKERTGRGQQPASNAAHARGSRGEQTDRHLFCDRWACLASSSWASDFASRFADAHANPDERLDCRARVVENVIVETDGVLFEAEDGDAVRKRSRKKAEVSKKLDGWMWSRGERRKGKRERAGTYRRTIVLPPNLK